MPASQRPSLWQRLLARTARRRPAEPDAADLGTAFGLDYVLDEAPLPPSLPAGSEAPAQRQTPGRRH